jgi:hypothetical protein
MRKNRKFNEYELSLIITECLLWVGIVVSILMILSPFLV